MKISFWTLGLIIVVILITLSTYNYINESSSTIKVGYLPSDHHAALIIADENNMFDKTGLKVQLVPFHSGNDLITALVKGKIDMGYCGITPVTTAISNGKDLKIVAPVNLEGSGIVTINNFTNPQNLNGKTVAIPSNCSMQFFLFQIYLAKNNISSENIKYYESEVPSMPFSLDENSFQAYVAWEPFVSAGKLYANGTILSHSSDIWKNHPCCVIVTRTKFIKENPNKLHKFLEIHENATKFIINNPQVNIDLMSRKTGISPDVEKEGIKHIKYLATPDSDFVENVLKIVQIQQKMGFIDKNLSASQIFDFNYL